MLCEIPPLIHCPKVGQWMDRYKFFVEYGFVLHDVSTVPVSKGEARVASGGRWQVVASVGLGWLP